MEKEVLPVAKPSQEVSLELVSQAQDYIRQAKAKNTLKAYQTDWRHFQAWCAAKQLASLPAAPETVVLYLTELASKAKTSTIQRRISSLSQAHQAAGLESPTKSAPVKAVWQGIRRAKGIANEGKAPILTEDIRVMIGAIRKGTLLSVRDRALLLLGFAGAFRRSELVALDVEDLSFPREGLVIALKRSKTDQEGRGEKKGIPYGSHPDTCPVRALRDYLERSGISSGPLFRSVNRHGRLSSSRLSDKAVALIVKRSAEAAGLDPAIYSGHSLRAGLATQASMAGVSERAIMAQTGHKSTAVMRRYIRDGNLFRENAAASIGL